MADLLNWPVSFSLSRAKAAFTTQRVPHLVKSETGSKIEMTLLSVAQFIIFRLFWELKGPVYDPHRFSASARVRLLAVFPFGGHLLIRFSEKGWWLILTLINKNDLKKQLL